MPKETILRNIVMLRMIPREPGSVTADVLRERLEDEGFKMDLRTIQRDLNKTSSVFPIVDFKTPHSNAKYWCWSRDASLWDMPKMDVMTALTFNLVESFLKRLIPRSMLNFMTHHFQRAEHLLKRKGKSTWGKWNKKISVIPRGVQLIPPKINQEVFETVFKCTIEEKILQIDYLKRNTKSASQYVLNPLGLVFNQEVVYLVATKKDNATVQHFALHRIKSAVTSEQPADFPMGFELKSYIERGAFQYLIENKPIILKALFDSSIAGHLYESKLSSEQKLSEQKDGRVLLEAKVMYGSALKWWLLGFGDGVEVLEPEMLRKEFKQIAKNLSDKYG